jgi:hypothetical protein
VIFQYATLAAGDGHLVLSKIEQRGRAPLHAIASASFSSYPRCSRILYVRTYVIASMIREIQSRLPA